MSYSFEQINEVNVLKVDDLWNPEENQALINTVEAKIELGEVNYIIDFSELPFMNSNGLAFLISILTRARSAGGEVVIANISEKIEQILVMTRLQSTFSIAESLEEALNTFAENPTT
jgi:anti-sigma B factor antagonist